MKQNRIVEKRTNKRNETHFLLQEMWAGILFVFLLPYVCACLWGHVGEEKEQLRHLADREVELSFQPEKEYVGNIELSWGTWTLPLEEYLVYELAATMPEHYEPETLKAQAVLLRTEFLQRASEQQTDNLTLQEPALEPWYGTGIDEMPENYREAVKETEGIYLCYEGKPVLVAYCLISNGHTRNAQENWNTTAYPYLAGVESGQDENASGYRQTVVVSKVVYLEKLKGIIEPTEELGTEELEDSLWQRAKYEYDSAGYVTRVSFYKGENQEEFIASCKGEQFRYLFGLQSASFTAAEDGGKIVFQVTGVGHGYGMSQYGANHKAVNGESYDEILKEYFPGTELAKIE